MRPEKHGSPAARPAKLADPTPRPRPKLAHWMLDHGQELRQAGAALEVSFETVRRICLPFDDAKRRVPSAELAGRIERWTEGAVTAADFYAPTLQVREAAE